MLARVLAFVMPIVSSSSLTAMQWNPHYQCFVEHYTKATCQTDAFHFLTAQLGHVDFANVVELGQEFKTPDSIGNLGAKCGLDDVNLFYSPQWKQAGSLKHGCMKEGDRPYLVQNFEHISGGHSLIVVGAHFPHSTDWNRLKTAISEVMTESGTTAVLLLADTNVNAGWSNARIMEALGLSGTVTGASTNTSTCCYPGFPNGFAFDRAIAVGMPGDVNTEVLLNTLPNSPDWAKSPEMHKPIVASFRTADSASLAAEDAATQRPKRRGTANLRAAKSRKRAILQAGEEEDGNALFQLSQFSEDEEEETDEQEQPRHLEL